MPVHHSDDLIFRVLDADGIPEAARQTFPLWNQGRSFDAYHLRIQEAFDRMGRRMRYVGLVAPTGAIVASCRMLDIALRWNGAMVPTLGIAAVFVPPEHRGHAYAHRLLRHAMLKATEEGAGAALLYSDIDPAFYERLGFTAFPALDWNADIQALPAADPYDVRPATPQDLPLLIDWYHADGASCLYPARSEDLWKFFRWWRQVENDLILEDHGRAVGYLTVTLDLRGVHVWEWAAPGAPHDRVWATVRRVAASLDVPHVCGWLRPDRRQPWMSTYSRSAAIPMLTRLPAGGTLPYPECTAFEELDHF